MWRNKEWIMPDCKIMLSHEATSTQNTNGRCMLDSVRLCGHSRLPVTMPGVPSRGTCCSPTTTRPRFRHSSRRGRSGPKSRGPFEPGNSSRVIKDDVGRKTCALHVISDKKCSQVTGPTQVWQQQSRFQRLMQEACWLEDIGF